MPKSFHLAQAEEVEVEHLAAESQLEAEQAGTAAFATLVADPGLVAENQAILDSLYPRGRWLIHLFDMRREQIFADNKEEEMPEICPTANDHEVGGSGKGASTSS